MRGLGKEPKLAVSIYYMTDALFREVLGTDNDMTVRAGLDPNRTCQGSPSSLIFIYNPPVLFKRKLLGMAPT